jgi:hypothetical protein
MAMGERVPGTLIIVTLILSNLIVSTVADAHAGQGP